MPGKMQRARKKLLEERGNGKTIYDNDKKNMIIRLEEDLVKAIARLKEMEKDVYSTEKSIDRQGEIIRNLKTTLDNNQGR